METLRSSKQKAAEAKIWFQELVGKVLPLGLGTALCRDILRCAQVGLKYRKDEISCLQLYPVLRKTLCIPVFAYGPVPYSVYFWDGHFKGEFGAGSICNCNE